MQLKKTLLIFTVLLAFTIPFFASDSDIQRYFNSGKASYSDGAYSIAVNFFEKALALDPESDLADDASYYIGMCYYQDGKFESALLAFAKFINNYPDSLNREKALFVTGNAYYKMGNYEKSILNLRNFIKAYPDSKLVPNARFVIAYSLLLNNKFDAASEEFGMIVQKFPASAFAEESLYRLGQSYLYDKDYNNAEEALQKFIAKYPSSVYTPEARFFLGKNYYLAGKTEDSVRVLSAPPDALSERTNFNYHNEVLYYLSLGYIRLDRYDDAVKSLDTLTSTTNEFREEALYKLGLIHKMNNRFDLAIGCYNRLLNDYGNSDYSIKALLELASCYVVLQDYENARKTYQRISALGPENELLSLSKLGELKFLKKDYQGAITDFDNIIARSLDTDYGKSAIYWKARSYMELKNYKDAINSFENYNKADPLSSRSDEINLFIGNAYVGLADYPSALAAYNNVFKTPGSKFADDALSAIAWVYAKKEEYVRSIETYQKLITTYPKSDLIPQAYFSIGVIKYNLKQYGQALDHLRTVSSHYKNSSYAPEAVVKIAWIHYKMENFQTLDQYTASLDFKELNLSPDQKAETYHLSGLARFRLNRFQEAVDSFRLAAESSSSGERQLEDILYIAKSYFNMGEYQRSIDQYQRYIHQSQSIGIKNEIPSALADIAWCYVKMGEMSDANASYKYLTDNYPSSVYTAQALYKLGEYYYNLGDFSNAVKNYSLVTGLSKDPNIASSAVYWNAWSWLNLSNRINAVNYFEKYSENYPKGDYAPDALWRAGALYYELNNFPKAKIHFKNLVKMFPKSENTRKAKEILSDIDLKEQSGGSEERLYQLMIKKAKSTREKNSASIKLALAYQKNGKTDEAVKQLKQVIKADKNDIGAEAALELADLYRMNENHLEAVKLYGNIFSVYKTAALFPRALYGLSYSNLKMGNKENAKKYIQRLTDKYPDSEWAVKAKALNEEMERKQGENP